MNKKKRLYLIKLVSSAKTGVFYISSKNKNNSKTKLKLKKYDNVVKKHVFFNESKIK